MNRFRWTVVILQKIISSCIITARKIINYNRESAWALVIFYTIEQLFRFMRDPLETVYWNSTKPHSYMTIHMYAQDQR